MNYIKHLTGFFEKVAVDRTLNPTHISLYIALFQFWNCNRFRNPISINRDEIMRISKISSKATYHKCLKNLHALGYINYEPSYNPFKGSHVSLFNFADDLRPLTKSEKNTALKNELSDSTAVKQVTDKSSTTIKTTSEQAVVSYINNTNNTNSSNNLNSVNLDKQAKKFDELNNYKNENLKKEKSAAKKEKDNIPELQFVKEYFLQNDFPEIEAIKFYNYFSSNGWLVGGKTPMVDWNAAAQNWILNAPNFLNNAAFNNKNRSDKLNIESDKDYAEPL